MAYVNDCFLNRSLFHEALKELFEVFCNKRVAGGSSAELLATFCDNILKQGGSEKLSDEDIEETLEKVGKLLAYISDRDIFEECYRKKLADRLLRDREAGKLDHEKNMLLKLKQQWGPEFILKVERMDRDLARALEIQNNFEEYLCDTDVNFGIDFSVRVLNPALWPTYESFDLKLPPEMAKCVEVFNRFYETTSPGKLAWNYSLDSCHINGKFSAKTIELMVSTSQAAVLLLFNNADSLSYSEIKNQLNLSHRDLIRLLHSLSCGKYKILNMAPCSNAVVPTNNFVFNANFTHAKKSIMIPLPLVDEAKTVPAENNNRRYAIDAAIVRIMKSRKELSHQQLDKECVEQLSHIFKPESKAIKERIEALIVREFLELDTKNNLYKYVP